MESFKNSGKVKRKGATFAKSKVSSVMTMRCRTGRTKERINYEGNEAVVACALCGEEFKGKLIVVSSDWDAKCAESLCEIFALDKPSYASYFQNVSAKYCDSCQQMVRDMEFTHQTIARMGAKLSFYRQTYESLLRGNQCLDSLRVVLDGIMSVPVQNLTQDNDYHQLESQNCESDPLSNGSDYAGSTYWSSYERACKSIKIETDNYTFKGHNSDANYDESVGVESASDPSWEDEEGQVETAVTNTLQTDTEESRLSFQSTNYSRSITSNSEEVKSMDTDGYSRDHKWMLQCKYTTECTFSTTKRIDMEAHIRSEHENDPTPHRSDLWDAKLTSGKEYLRHRSTHTKGKERGRKRENLDSSGEDAEDFIEVIQFEGEPNEGSVMGVGMKPKSQQLLFSINQFIRDSHARAQQRVNDPNPYHCDLCDEKLDTIEKYLEHRRSAHICQKSKTGRDEEKGLMEDSKLEGGKKVKLLCGMSECGYSTDRNWRLEVHVRAEHMNDPKPYHCTSCEVKLKSRRNYLAHRTTHAVGKRSKLTERKAKPPKDVILPKNVKCTFCGYITTSDALLNQHTEQHRDQSPDHPFRCVLCSDYPHLRNSVDLSRHVKYTHNQPLVKCELCQKAFSRRSHLQRHMKHLHALDSDGTWKCKECDHVAPSKGGLKVHVAQFHRHERPFLCTECGLTFKTTANLKIHIMRHTGEKPYKCKLCGVAFTESGSLSRHEESHMQSRAHVCQCGKGFKTACFLSRHKRLNCSISKDQGICQLKIRRKKTRIVPGYETSDDHEEYEEEDKS